MTAKSHLAEIIDRYRHEGFSDATIIHRAITGGVDEQDAALLDVSIEQLKEELRNG